ncbi:MAG: ABC transporter ATP-binding protein [Actinomycetaceae bacterium]|nr:ABC transporter ATP-binding protein [Actinomycetaceae bacterium]
MLIKLIWSYLRHHKFPLALALFMQILQACSMLAFPTLNALIIDKGISVGDTGYILSIGTIMLGVITVHIASTLTSSYLIARLSMGLGRFLRLKMYSKVQRFSTHELSAFGSDTLITRTTNDVQQIQMVVMLTFAMGIISPLMLIGSLVMMIATDVVLSLVLTAALPLLLGFIIFVFMRLAKLFRLQQKRVDNVNRVVREHLSGARIIRAFVQHERAHRDFTVANDDVLEVMLKITKTFAFVFPIAQLIISFSSVAAVWFGALRIESGNILVGQMTAFLLYLNFVLFSFLMASSVIWMVPRAHIAAQRIIAVLDTDPLLWRRTNTNTPLPPSPLTFGFTNVSYTYPQAQLPCLKDVTLTFHPGTTTAIIGSTGSGKTTLMRLFARLIEPSSGTYWLSASTLSRQSAASPSQIPALHPQLHSTDVSVSQLRKRIAMVPQSAYVFRGTIASNVSCLPTEFFGRPLDHLHEEDAASGHSFHPDYTTGTHSTGSPSSVCEQEEVRQRVREALKAAAAWDFVAALDDGMDTIVEAGGVNFSGGQRQRLAIARALYRQADLYIFDDALSALDYTTDATVRHHIAARCKNAAVIMVAQRVATIRHADSIVVMDDGRIVAQGTHAELLRTCPIYQEIAASQLSDSEVA